MNKIEEKFFRAFCKYIEDKSVFSVHSESYSMKIADVAIEQTDIYSNEIGFVIDAKFSNTKGKTDIYSFGAILESQCNIGPYISDFSLSIDSIGGTISTLCIEIDGHEWHEKTKEQASLSKRRDREIIAMDNIPIHFTGSEIYTNTIKCVEEVMKIAISVLYNTVMRHKDYYDREWEIMGIDK